MRLIDYFQTFLKRNTQSLFYKFISVLDKQTTDLELAVDDLKLAIQLSTATGEELDDIGRLFRLKRLDGESDADYRQRIELYWNLSKSGGTLQELLDVINSLGGTVNSYTEGDANVVIDYSIPVNQVSGSYEFLQKIKAAGVSLSLYINPLQAYGDITYITDNDTVTINVIPATTAYIAVGVNAIVEERLIA